MVELEPSCKKLFSIFPFVIYFVSFRVIRESFLAFGITAIHETHEIHETSEPNDK